MYQKKQPKKMSIETSWFKGKSPRTSISIKEVSCDYDGSVSTLDSSQRNRLFLTGKHTSFFFLSFFFLSIPAITFRYQKSNIILESSFSFLLLFLTHLCLGSPLLFCPLIFFFFLLCLLFTLHNLHCGNSCRKESKLVVLQDVNENKIFDYDYLFTFYLISFQRED